MRFRSMFVAALVLVIMCISPAFAGDYPDSMEDVLIHNGNESTRILQQGDQDLRDAGNRYFQNQMRGGSTANSGGQGGSSGPTVRQKVACWSYRYSASYEQHYIALLAQQFARKLPKLSIRAIEVQFRHIMSEYRAAHSRSPFTTTDGAYSINNAIAYMIEQAAIALGDRKLPTDSDRVELAIRLQLERTPYAMQTASDEQKQALYEYAVIFGKITEHNRISNKMHAGLKQIDRQYLQAYAVNMPIVMFVYSCHDELSCQTSRAVQLSTLRQLAASPGGQGFMP